MNKSSQIIEMDRDGRSKQSNKEKETVRERGNETVK